MSEVQPYTEKYTERDVREDESLITLAEDWISAYAGDFEFLRRAKEMMAEIHQLTPAMAKGVLNCMRHDWNIAGRLPTPRRASDDVVVQFASEKERRRKNANEQCSDSKPHYAHSQKDELGYVFCAGVPWPINRSSYSLDARVKMPFCRAKGGRNLHKTTPVGYCTWYPLDPHGWGFSRHIKPYLTVKLVCRFPSYIARPILMAEEPSDEVMHMLGLKKCRYCFDGD